MFHRSIKILATALIISSAWLGRASAQSWQPLATQPTFLVKGASSPLLLTDGTVMLQDAGSQDWWRLAPDNTGSYVNGTWSQLASLQSGYGPLYHASAVLPDGRVIIEGGEYNLLNLNPNPVWSNQGAIYDPAANTWTSVAPPSGWSSIGDAQSVVLASGTFMLANCCTKEAALLNPRTLTWTTTGAGKFDINDEEGWTLLPNKQVLAVDAYAHVSPPIDDPTNSEVYVPSPGKWHSAGSTIVKLADVNSDGSGSHELGPAVLRPDGTVFHTGATGHNSIYNSETGTWTPGPDFPDVMGQGQLDVADGPASLLPNGNVLVAASPGIFHSPIHFFEFNGSSLIPEPGTPNASGDSSYYGNMLLLPTGQVLFTDFSNDIEIYTPAGTYNPGWAPRIQSVPTTISPGGSYLISGHLFNGLSQAAAYGDDAQAATNYPLVRITNRASGHVFYSRTHGHSSMAVAFGGLVSTHFDVPTAQEKGISDLVVVANGIPSRPATVNVQ
jgi:hypothetical protein